MDVNLVSNFTPIELSNDIITGFSTDPFEHFEIESFNPLFTDDDEALFNYSGIKEPTKKKDNLSFLLPNFSSSTTASLPVISPSPTTTSVSRSSSKTKFNSSDANLSLPEILKQEGVHFRISSGYRGKGSLRNGLTKQGRRSNHNRLDERGNPMAYDIVPNGVSWAQLKKEIYGNPRIVNYLRSRSWGIIDETRADVKKRTGATGDHLHIGADSWAQRMLEEYMNNPKLIARGQEGMSLPDASLVSSFAYYKNPTFDTFYKLNNNIGFYGDEEIAYRNKKLFNEILNYTPESVEEEKEEEDPITRSPFYYSPQQQQSEQQTEQQSTQQPLRIYTPRTNQTTFTAGFSSSQPTSGSKALHYRVMNYLMKKGLPKHVAAGIAGNLYVESGINAGSIGDGGTSGGIAQWHGPRFRQLKMFANRRNKDWKDLDTQLDFLWYELTTSYRQMYNRLKNSKNSDEATNIWGHDFERFRGYQNFNNSNYRKRRKYANYFNSL